MKQPEHFSAFLEDVVNLNQSRLDDLNAKVSAIQSFLHRNLDEFDIIEFYPQGSWAHGTIIKPVDGRSFDADMMMLVSVKPGLDPKEYVLGLARTFRASGVYDDKTRASSHCVTIEYAGDVKIDITPCVVVNDGIEHKYVCNKNDNVFEPSNPEGYTQWIALKDSWSGTHGLKTTTRLMKYLRDTKTTFSCPSMLLTTLLGSRVEAYDVGSADFYDVPSALQTIMSRLDDWLQARPTKPIIPNPVYMAEDLADFLSDDQYENFREFVHLYRGWIDDAVNELDYDESIRKWRKIFGDDFARGEAESRAISIVDNLAALVQPGIDMVEAVIRKGVGLLRSFPSGFPHVEVSKRRENTTQLQVTIRAIEKPSREADGVRYFNSGDTINAGSGIEFEALQASGMPFPNEYFVEWQVVNTDKTAYGKKSLRGGFYSSDTPNKRWEGTQFRGVHWVQAFLINRRNNKIYGKSARYFVVIG